MLLVRLSRFEYAELLEVGEEGKPNLRADCGDLQLRQDQSQILDSANPHSCAIGDESRRFAGPFLVQKIDCVFERCGCAAVVLRCDKDIAVK